MVGNICQASPGTPWAVSSQAFFRAQGGYNIVVRVCDTNDDGGKKPSDYAAPSMNGSDANVCGGNAVQPCCVVSCSATTIMVTSQGSETCY